MDKESLKQENTEVVVTKWHKALFVFDIIIPIITMLFMVLGTLGLQLYYNYFNVLHDMGNEYVIEGILGFLLVVVVGITPVYLAIGLYLVLIALAALSLVFRKAFIKAKKLWILIYVWVAAFLPMAGAAVISLVSMIQSMFS